MKSISWIIAAAVLGAIALPALPARAASPQVGHPALAETVKTLDGQEIDLTHPQGKVLVVNVWATWCPPCRAEMPMLDAFYRKRKDAGLQLVALSADRPRARGDVQKVMQAFSFPAAMLGDAKVNALGAPRVLPITYVVDQTGTIRAVFGLGGAEMAEQALSNAVDPLLK